MSFWHWIRGHRITYRNITVKGIVMGQDKLCSCGLRKMMW